LQLTNIVYSYAIEGIYTTVFSVADSGGFGDSDFVEIEVIPEPFLLWIIGLIPLWILFRLLHRGKGVRRI